MRSIIPISFAALILTSCGVYQTSFDCPPGKGIGCKPVSEVLDMIVEKEEGGDLFVRDSETAQLLKDQEKRKKRVIAQPNEEKKLFLLKEHEKESVLVEQGALI